MKVLVSVASKHGATSEIAAAIATELSAAGHQPVVVHPEDVHELDGVGAVVLGSAVYAGHWLKPARQLAERLESQLTGQPVWLFSSGPLGDPPMPDGDALDVTAIESQTHACEHRVFSGRLDRSTLGFGEKALVRALRAPEGDFRDWDEIRRWAVSIAAQVSNIPVAPTSRPAE